MTEKYKILAKFIKDASSETANIETYLFVKENISKYQLNIDITSKALKDKLIEINTTIKFKDKEPNKKKSYYVYCRSGKRSLAACEIMTDLGFSSVFNLESGYLGWIENGYEIVR